MRHKKLPKRLVSEWTGGYGLKKLYGFYLECYWLLFGVFIFWLCLVLVVAYGILFVYFSFKLFFLGFFFKLWHVGSISLTRYWIGCSVAQLCLPLCDPMDCSMPGSPVLHHLLEPAQTHVHLAGDAMQSSHPLLSPSPPALNLSQHQCFPTSWLFASGGQSIGASASASVLPMNIRGWFPLGLELVGAPWLNLGPLHWDLRVLATGPPGKSHGIILVLIYVSQI